MALLAGQIAERKSKGKKTTPTAHTLDNTRALELATHLCATVDTAKTLRNYLFSATMDLLEANWWKVEVLATALLQKPMISMAEYLAMVRKRLRDEAHSIPISSEADRTRHEIHSGKT